MYQAVLTLSVVAVAVSSPTLPPPFTEECVSGHYPPPSDHRLQQYVVDLDLPPQQRWNEVITAKKKEILSLIKYFKDFARNLGRLGIISIDFIERDFNAFLTTIPSPYREEMEDIAVILEIEPGDVLLYNIFYEIFQVCTSIVAEAEDGSMYHARNLDFGLFLGWDLRNNTWGLTEALRPALVTLDFQQSGKTVFKAVNYAGFVGILTGMKPGAFSVTINSRFDKDGGYNGIIAWLLGNRAEHWVSFLTREALMTASNFSEARHKLATVPLTAPVYYTVGGLEKGEGCVITRARSHALDIWDIKNKTNPGSPWYILETNYDHWESPLFVDDRRTPAHDCMKHKGQAQVGFSGLFDVLSSRPVLNKLTTYTTLMHVKTGAIEAYKQYCSDPCWPW